MIRLFSLEPGLYGLGKHMQKLKHVISNIISEANKKLTPREVEKAVLSASGADKKTVRLLSVFSAVGNVHIH